MALIEAVGSLGAAVVLPNRGSTVELAKKTALLPVDRWDPTQESIVSFLWRGGNPNAKVKQDGHPIIIHLARNIATLGNMESLDYLLAGRKEIPEGRAAKSSLEVGANDGEGRTAFMELARHGSFNDEVEYLEI